MVCDVLCCYVWRWVLSLFEQQNRAQQHRTREQELTSPDLIIHLLLPLCLVVEDLGPEHVWDGNSALLCEPNGGGGEGNAQGRSVAGEVVRLVRSSVITFRTTE